MAGIPNPKLNIKFFCLFFVLFGILSADGYAEENKPMKIRLNPPDFKNNFKILLEQRYSCRDFQDKALNLDDLASILWAGCGRRLDAVTGATRIIPSAGATYPLELYVVVGRNAVEKLIEGVYHYLIEEHALEIILGEDKRRELAFACLGQNFINEAPLSLVITAQFERTMSRYSERGERYVYMEVGHACQNIYLAASNLGLGTVEVGAFVDEKVRATLGIDKDFAPLSVMPIGYPKRNKWAK
jgi:SagB-type dehydrogenase family enzyme